MPGAMVRAPQIPTWVNDSSVMDSPQRKIARALIHLAGLNTPQGVADQSILSLMNPMGQGAASGLESILAKWRRLGVDLEVYESRMRPNMITLSKIVVPEGSRGAGIGTQVMEDLARYADQSGKNVALTPDASYGATSVDRLKRFYRRFGFTENAGRSRDLSVSESMIRPPRSGAK